MPDPPDVNLFTRYVLENPYPLASVIFIASLAAAWIALRDGRKPLLTAAGVGTLIAAAVLLTGILVITPAERGREVTLEMVERIVQGDINGGMALFTPNATFAVGSPQNPGMDIGFIRRQAEWLHGRYTIESNQISSLRSYTESSRRGVVHMTCRTDVGGYGPTPTQWVLWIDEQPDGEWKISRLTMVSLYGRQPNLPIR
jgi:hypothetical protein